MRFVAVGYRSACDEGIQKADVQTLARGSSQLGGAEDGGDQADPSRIEERLGGVANVATDRLEQIEPVSKKRPFFGKEFARSWSGSESPDRLRPVRSRD